MDLGIVIGIPLGLCMILFSIFIGGYPLSIYLDLQSVFITIGGSFFSMMVATPLSQLRKVLSIFKIALFGQNLNVNEIIPRIVAFSEKSRREGLLSLEDEIESLENQFFRTGVQLVVDGTDPDVIKNILYNEINQINARHEAGIAIFDLWSKVAPAWGMIGTLYGLVGMLQSLGDQAGVGQGMATALITTFYGAIMCYIFFLPIKTKLESRDGDETLLYEIIIEGILSIQTGDNPRIVEQKLLAFLPPNDRDKIRQTE